MPQKTISPLVEEIRIEQDGDDKIVTLVLRYTGTEDLMDEIQEGEQLTLELPSKPQP